jgi:hypothetical protein
MGELFAYIRFAVHISLVIVGVFAAVSLFSTRKPRASQREMKIALVVVLGLLIIVAIVLAVISTS